MQEETQKRNNNSLLGALAAILVLAIAGFIYFFVSNKKVAKEAERMEILVDSLDQVRSSLALELDSLNNEYYAIAIENDSLKGSLENSKEIIQQKDNQIWSANKRARDADALRQQITDLEAAKNELASTITRLVTENEELKEANAELQEQVTTFKQENTDLQSQVSEMNQANDLMQQRMAQLIDASYKASGMQVEAMRSSGKSTIKARQVKKVNVGFDLIDVPEEFHGAQNIYLSITDANGLPVVAEAIKVKVGSEAKALVIESVDSKKVNIGNSQRIEFNYEVPAKLKRGFFVVSIYTGKGLLGSTILKLI